MSGLTPQNVQVLLGKRDGKTSDMLATPGTLTRAENVVMDKTGELKRRPGGEFVVNLNSGTTKRIASVNGELLGLNRGISGVEQLSLVGVNPSTGITPTTRMSAPAIAHTLPAISAATATDQRCHDYVTSGGYDWHVYEALYRNASSDANQIILDVYDSVTRARVHTRVVASNSATPIPTRPRIAVVGSNIIITYVDTALGVSSNEGSSTSLYAYKIPVATPSTAAIAVLVDTMIGNLDPNILPSPYDIQPLTGSSTMLGFIYRVAGAVFGLRFRVRTWNCTTMATAFTSNGSDITATANGDLGGTAVCFLKHNHSDNAWYAASVVSTTGGGVRNNVALHAAVTNASSSVVDVVLNASVNASWRSVTGFVDSNLKTWVMCETRVAGPAWPTPVANGVTGADRYVQVYTRTSAGVIAAGVIVYGVGLASRVFSFSGTPTVNYIVYVATSNISPTYFLASSTSAGGVPTPDEGGALGVAFQGTAGIIDADPLETGTLARLYTPQRNHLPTPQVSGTQVRIAAYRRGANASAAAPQREAWIIGFQLTALTEQPQNLGDQLIIPVGSPRAYDGLDFTSTAQNIRPATFQFNPEAPTGVGGVSGGTLVPTDIYQYAYCYAYKDMKNRLVLSAPSPVLSYAVPGGLSGITFQVYTHVDRYAFLPYSIYVFRSAKNPGVNAPLFFQRAINITPVNNRTVTYTDLGADFDPGEELYTQNGAVLENVPLPPCSRLAQWKGRLWGILDEFPNGFCYSKALRPSFGLEFNDDFQGLIEDEYGRLYGMAPLDERFVFFKENAVYYIGGDGPDNAGNGSFTEPKRIDGVPGCSNPDSIVVAGPGVFYQAPDKGIWLLKADLGSVFIGKSQLDITAAASSITGALYEPNKQHVRFYNSATGVTLNYDLQNDLWTSFTEQPAVSAIMHNDQCHYLRTDQSVNREDASGTIWNESTRLSTATYQAVIELAWLALAQLSGYMRVWVVSVLGRLLGVHTLSLDMTADYGTGTTTRSLASSVVVTSHGYRIEAKVPLQMQQNTALRLLIKDNSSNTAGFAVTGLTLQCGFAPGRRPRLPAAHTMG